MTDLEPNMPTQWSTVVSVNIDCLWSSTCHDCVYRTHTVVHGRIWQKGRYTESWQHFVSPVCLLNSVSSINISQHKTWAPVSFISYLTSQRDFPPKADSLLSNWFNCICVSVCTQPLSQIGVCVCVCVFRELFGYVSAHDRMTRVLTPIFLVASQIIHEVIYIFITMLCLCVVFAPVCVCN